jgi:hypothetical protein
MELEPEQVRPSERARAFLHTSVGFGSVGQAVLSFHQRIRPRLAALLGRARPRRSQRTWEILAEIECRLVTRLHHHAQVLMLRGFWGATPPPQVTQLICESLMFRRTPRVRFASLEEELASAPELDDLNVAASTSILLLYTHHVCSATARLQMLSKAGIVVAYLESRRLPTSAHLYRALLAECWTHRRGNKPKELRFATEEAWEAYCVRVARNALRDALRRAARGPGNAVSLDEEAVADDYLRRW